MYNVSSISKIFIIADLISNLIENKLLDVSEETMTKLKEIIKKDDYESTLIIF